MIKRQRVNDMYEKRPRIILKEQISTFTGYTKIINELLKDKKTKKIALECYPGIDSEKVAHEIRALKMEDLFITTTNQFYQSSNEIKEKLTEVLTDDRVFGRLTDASFLDFLAKEKNESLNQADRVLLIGVGAAELIDADMVVYANLTKRNIQLKLKAGAENWQADNAQEEFLKKVKRAYYFEWPAADERKKLVLPSSQYLIDLNEENTPKMIKTKDYYNALRHFSNQPFRLVPYFEPGIWGGKWMQKKFDVGKEEVNLAWWFDGVPEENSVIFEIGTVTFEVPGNDLVLFYPVSILGEKVFGRFGSDFPIRFDYLDTMAGGNLSLQVHPTLDYAYRKFGLKYTQDESYYIMDCEEDAYIYLGLKEEVGTPDFIQALEESRITGRLDVEKYINKIKVKKHDHFLIPAGTIHCSGENCVVLEISATPNRFTFKLWDWERVDLDEIPRPIHIEHGKQVINESMKTNRVFSELVNQVVDLTITENIHIERTGLHPLEPIETHRLTFCVPIEQTTEGSVNMLNLVEGEGIVIESTAETFEPLKINYGETFIIPENIKNYVIRPIVDKETCIVMKAFIK